MRQLRALAALSLAPHQVAVFGGIGCSGKTPYYLGCNGVHTLHGRVLSFASGAKLAEPTLTVIAVGGDGDGLSIGAGHFVNTGRRNIDLTYILFNNGVYGLTKGQASPTLRRGEQTRRMSQPAADAAVNPLSLALVSGYTWIGRGYAYDVATLSELLTQAISHPGMSLLEVLQPCPTYNDLHTKAWYEGEDAVERQPRLYTLDDRLDELTVQRGESSESRQAVLLKAHKLALEWGNRIPTGIIFRDLTDPVAVQRVTGTAERCPAGWQRLLSQHAVVPADESDLA